MSFNADVEKLFQIMRASGAKAFTSLTVDEARRQYNEKSEKLGGASILLAQVQDFAAATSIGDIPVRLYTPHGLSGSSAALIYVHGGGWVLGGLESHDKVCRRIAASTPCRVVAIDYRLAPEHPFPAGLDDVIAAVSWIAANATALDIDQDRIAVGGDSAGGSISAVACLHARDHGPKLRAQVLIYPSTDSTPEVRLWPSRIENGQVPPLNTDALRWLSSKFIPTAGFDRRDWRMSPLYAKSHAELPRALVLTAQYDPLRDEGKAYADRLREAGVPVAYHDFPGQIHGFIEYGGILSDAVRATDEIATFLRSAF